MKASLKGKFTAMIAHIKKKSELSKSDDTFQSFRKTKTGQT
jgi:hypothetical protein